MPEQPVSRTDAAECSAPRSPSRPIARLRTALILLLTLFFVGLTHYSSSPLRNIVQHQPLLNCDNNPTGTDSVVFLYIGRIILNGGMPYRDAFDHKGPLVYLLDAAGLAVGGVFGVWLLELLFLTVSTIFAYKTARFFAAPPIALFTTVVAILWYTARCDSNFCETWSVPFLLTSLYFWIRYLKSGCQIGKTATFTVGLCFAGVLLLKPNLTALWMLFCLTVAAVSIRRAAAGKEPDGAVPRGGRALGFLCSRVALFLLGAAALLLPVLGWLWKNGAWNDFIAQYWDFNRIYCQVGFDQKLITFARCFACIPIEAYFSFFAVIGYIILARRAKNGADRALWISMEIFLILNLALMSMSGRSARHYSAPLVAPFLPFLAAAFDWCFQKERSGRKKFVRYALLVLLLVPTVVYDIPMFRPVRDMTKMAVLRRLHPKTDYSKFYRVYGYPYFYEEFDAVTMADWLKKNTTPETRIASFGIGGRIFYWYAERTCVTKYFYIRDTHLENGYLPEIAAELKEKAPEVFIFQTKGGYPSRLGKERTARADSPSERKTFPMPDEIAEWIAAEGYEKVFENDTYEVYRK